MLGRFAGLEPSSNVFWLNVGATDAQLKSTLTEAQMRAFLKTNFGYFASRTKSIVDGETITTEKVAEKYFPFIPVYDRGALFLLDTNKEPVQGILDITYQTKLSETTTQ